jgi:hypothetical protein
MKLLLFVLSSGLGTGAAFYSGWLLENAVRLAFPAV